MTQLPIHLPSFPIAFAFAYPLDSLFNLMLYVFYEGCGVGGGND
jgi:hypothetical protein